MQILRSIIFWILFYLAVFLLVSIYFPVSFFVRRKNLADQLAKGWAQVILFFLKHILGIDHQIINIQNMPQTPCIIACKHQSAWETIVFHLLCRYPAYAYKKELLKVPFYGWFVARMTGVKVDRQGKASALKEMIRETKAVLHNGHNLVIFPQGTRVPVGASVETYPYQVGIAALYLACNVPVVPARLDSGKFWPKGFVIRKKGTIKMEFLEPILPGLKREEFMAKIEELLEKDPS